ncbi:M48 family metalloprotease [Streptomyces sp. NPDC088254]|uniref:M48 family metallopeptidase n=1 Tax=Streptomyces sp. NPDC088254 TaxID=3365847 RepID=UPI0037F8CD74
MRELEVSSREPETVGFRRIGWSAAAACGLAALVHVGTAGLLIGGLLLVVLGWSTVVQPLIGLLMIGLAVQVRPRFSRPRPDLPTLGRDDAPSLFALLDSIADAARARHIDIVQLSGNFAVRLSLTGVRRRPCLELGLPLWQTFTPQQRVAAVAHEVGHFAAGDIRRGTLVGTALSSLAGGADLTQSRPEGTHSGVALSPTSRYADEATTAVNRFKARGRTNNWIMWLPGLLVRGTARLLTRLTRSGSLHVEFQADEVAARIASTRAVDSVLRDRRLADAVGFEVHRLAVTARTFGHGKAASTEREFWDRVAAHARALPHRTGDGPESPLHADPEQPAHRRGEDCAPVPEPQRLARLSRTEAQPATITLDPRLAGTIAEELSAPGSLLARKIIRDCVTR